MPERKIKLSATFEGVVSLAFKTEVLFVKVALKATGSLKTEIGMKLDQHDDGIDLVGYHDGVVAELSLAADVNRSGTFGTTREINNKYSYKNKFIVAAPLKESESRMRVNLFGKQRILPEREILPSEPWAMGYNRKADN